MGRVVSIKVPVWAIPEGVVMSTKDALSSATSLRLSPLFEGLDGNGPIERIRLDQTSDTYLSLLERIHSGVPKGRICAGLIAAYHRQPNGKPSRTGNRIEQMTSARGFEARAAQLQLYAEMNGTLAQDKIGFHEASTGTGKTLAILASAVDCAAGGERVVIAVPTIGLVESIDAELQNLQETGVDLPAWQPIYGRGEFVSRAAAETRLAEDPSDELRDLLAAARETGDWRLASWQRRAPHVIGLSTCAIGSLTTKDDPGLLAYKAQFSRDAAGIIICTHAMLAIDTVLRRMRIGTDADFKEQRQKERDGQGYDYRIENMLRASFERDEHRHLPEYQVAFVDEAHLLEQAFASVMAVDVSFWQLLRALRSLRELNPGAVPTDALRLVEKAFEALRRSEDTDSQLIGNEAAEARHLTNVSKALGLVKETRKHCDKDPEAREFVTRARTAIQAFLGDRLAVALLSYSPSRRFPRLLMGRKTSHREMHYLWSSMRAGALVSATLNVTTAAGEPSVSSVRYLLNVPIDRARALTPIVNKEIYRPVTCFTPNQTRVRSSGWLVRPSGGDDDDETTWFNQMADAILRLTQDAVGGTLVLTTSYRALDALHERLKDGINGRLIVSSPGKRLAHIAEEFLDAAAAGKRPVWIATGAAWTGLDLSGVRRGFQAADDNIITDLVLTNIPFRTNRSLTHASRVMRGGNFEFFDTFVKFKQGLGRLVRNPSPELPANRRLWILDGRLYDLKWRGRLAIFAALLRDYRQEPFG
jgi:CRISPR type IV-associated DEAD/DEAH-box helicase Csf4